MKRWIFCFGRQFYWMSAVLLFITFSSDLLAQSYFGRNKVQYEEFKFKIMKTQNFDLYFYPPEQGAANDAAQMVERWYTRFSTFFDHEIKFQQPLILYANHADFQQTNVISGLISPGTGGVTEGLKKSNRAATNRHLCGQ